VCISASETQSGFVDTSSERKNSIRRRSGIRRFVRNTIGAAVAVFIGLTVSTPVMVDNTHLASLEIPAITKTAVVVPEKSVEAIEISSTTDVQVCKAETVALEEESTLNQPADDQMTAKTVNKDSQVVDPRSPRFIDSDDYILVVGSLVSTQDAEEYVTHLSRMHKDLNFGVARQGKRIRIYAATGKTMEQARQMMKNPLIAKSFSDAWVTTRN
ncbi:MAG: hypothetical protein K2K84_00995, partial [Muribaculaceae bacterium]|nr:hypothetical protein [Muribaculaceae bacterium]